MGIFSNLSLYFSGSGTATFDIFYESLVTFRADSCSPAMTSFPTFTMVSSIQEISLCGNDLETSDVTGNFFRKELLHEAQVKIDKDQRVVHCDVLDRCVRFDCPDRANTPVLMQQHND